MKKNLLLIILVLLLIIVISYIGITKYKESMLIENIGKEVSKEEVLEDNKKNEVKFVTSSTNTNYSENQGYNYSQDMKGSNEINYKKITTYEQYEEDLKKWPGLVKMTAEDFNENFVIVMAGENYHTTGLEVENISTDETNLVIDLKQKDKYDETSVLTIKLSKEYERENIIIRNNPIKPTSPNNMEKIENIPAGYSIEEAIADGCLVILDHKENNGREVLSDNKKAMDEFVEKCNNEEDAFIRIYEYNIIDNANVIDVGCKNGKISICSKNVTQEGAVVGAYKSGYKINVREGEHDGIKYKSYELEDEIENKRLICSIDL